MDAYIEESVLSHFAEMGYSLKEDDGDHTVALYFKDGYIDRFNQTKTTEAHIREACQEHWNRLIEQETY